MNRQNYIAVMVHPDGTETELGIVKLDSIKIKPTGVYITPEEANKILGWEGKNDRRKTRRNRITTPKANA